MDTPSKQSAGGTARATNLTPERRAEIAREAARLRWRTQREAATESGTTQPPEEFLEAETDVIEPSSAMPVARWRGSLNIVGIDVPCYVLDTGQKIIGRVSATEVLTGIKGGGALEKYIGVKALEPFIDKDLVLEKFVPFRLLEVEGRSDCNHLKGLPFTSPVFCLHHRGARLLWVIASMLHHSRH